MIGRRFFSWGFHGDGGDDFLFEQGGFGDLEPDVEADADQDGGEQERDSPSPGQERVAGEQGDDGQHDGGEDGAGGGAHVGEAGGEATLFLVGVFQCHECGAAPFAADGEALDQAQQDQQDRGEDADGLVGGQQADREAGRAHDAHRQDEHRFTADPVAEVAEDDPAEGADDVADGEGGERGDGGDDRGEVGEEQLTEHQGGGGAVEQEVVELDGAAQKAGEQHPAHLLGITTPCLLGRCWGCACGGSGVGHGHSCVWVLAAEVVELDVRSTLRYCAVDALQSWLMAELSSFSSSHLGLVCGNSPGSGRRGRFGGQEHADLKRNEH